MDSYTRYTKDYLNESVKSDPWSDLANAVVAQAADDYRRLCHKLVERGATMTDFEFNIINGKIREIEGFFTSDWGYFLSHRLAPVIWEKLQAEFADGIKEMLVKREAWIAEDEKRKEAERQKGLEDADVHSDEFV